MNVKPIIGETLPNGAIVVAYDKNIVLALRSGIFPSPYITWHVSTDDSGAFVCEGGDYCHTLPIAMESYNERLKYQG